MSSPPQNTHSETRLNLRRTSEEPKQRLSTEDQTVRVVPGLGLDAPPQCKAWGRTRAPCADPTAPGPPPTGTERAPPEAATATWVPCSPPGHSFPLKEFITPGNTQKNKQTKKLASRRCSEKPHPSVTAVSSHGHPDIFMALLLPPSGHAGSWAPGWQRLSSSLGPPKAPQKAPKSTVVLPPLPREPPAAPGRCPLGMRGGRTRCQGSACPMGLGARSGPPSSLGCSSPSTGREELISPGGMLFPT